MELADIQDLGSCGAIRVGSSPTARTKPGFLTAFEAARKPGSFLRRATNVNAAAGV